jgi:hypothetical protein
MILEQNLCLPFEISRLSIDRFGPDDRSVAHDLELHPWRLHYSNDYKKHDCSVDKLQIKSSRCHRRLLDCAKPLHVEDWTMRSSAAFAFNSRLAISI